MSPVQQASVGTFDFRPDPRTLLFDTQLVTREVARPSRSCSRWRSSTVHEREMKVPESPSREFDTLERFVLRAAKTSGVYHCTTDSLSQRAINDKQEQSIRFEGISAAFAFPRSENEEPRCDGIGCGGENDMPDLTRAQTSWLNVHALRLKMGKVDDGVEICANLRTASASTHVHQGSRQNDKLTLFIGLYDGRRVASGVRAVFVRINALHLMAFAELFIQPFDRLSE
jgi:hypothetical protein